MRAYLYREIKITGRTSPNARASLSGNPDLGAIFYSLRNVYPYGFSPESLSCSAALDARSADDTMPSALPTRPREMHRALSYLYPAGTAARWACGHFG